MFEGRAAIGYDHGYDAEVFYLGLALDEGYVEGFVEGCLERIGEDDPDEEDFLRGIWEEGDDLRGFVLEALKGVDPSSWEYSCPDHHRRGKGCKHALACWTLFPEGFLNPKVL